MSTVTTLPDATTLGVVTLTVADLARSRDFYERVVGLGELSSDDSGVTFGADTPLIKLREKAGVRPQPRFSTGLYHVAILVPTRLDLARTIAHIAAQEYPLQGYADHRVSEAFYLADPDGNGLEIYRDRPRQDWKITNGTVDMGNDPIDLDEFFAEAQHNPRDWEGAAAGTRIGHMHLRVGDSSKAIEFYTHIIGFQVMARWHGAGFVAAGGYHHHLGLNNWNSQSAPPPPENSVGLDSWTIKLPSANDLPSVQARLDAANVNYASTDTSITLRDPWRTKLHITA